MKIPKFSRKPKRFKTAIVNGRAKIKSLRKKLVQAMRNYKEAVDKERIESAKKMLR
jgi:hypothetical protein